MQFAPIFTGILTIVLLVIKNLCYQVRSSMHVATNRTAQGSPHANPVLMFPAWACSTHAVLRHTVTSPPACCLWDHGFLKGLCHICECSRLVFDFKICVITGLLIFLMMRFQLQKSSNGWSISFLYLRPRGHCSTQAGVLQHRPAQKTPGVHGEHAIERVPGMRNAALSAHTAWPPVSVCFWVSSHKAPFHHPRGQFYSLTSRFHKCRGLYTASKTESVMSISWIHCIYVIFHKYIMNSCLFFAFFPICVFCNKCWDKTLKWILTFNYTGVKYGGHWRGSHQGAVMWYQRRRCQF